MSEDDQPLALPEKLAYALGDGAFNFYWKTLEFFLLFYYTDVFGLSAAATGTMLLSTRLGDAIADPIMGMIADRTRSRWGRFRPYLLWLAIPLAVAGVLTFSTPHLSSHGKLLYAYITYSFLMIIYTAVNIPYAALMGVLTPDSTQRTSVSSIRFAGAFLVAIFVQKFTMFFVNTFGHGDDAVGWQRTMILYGLLAIAMLLTCFRMTHERVPPIIQEDDNVFKDLIVIGRSGPWRSLFFVVALILAAYAVRGAASPFYIKYYVHRESLIGAFLLANGLASFAGILLTERLAILLGKRLALQSCLLSGSLTYALFFLVGPHRIGMIFALQVLSSFSVGPIAPLFFAMFADVADHSEWTSRRQTTGLVFASALFAVKMGAAVGSWVLGVVLSASGYVANSSQSTQSLTSILISMSILPGCLLAGSALAILTYSITDNVMKDVEIGLSTVR